MAASPGSVGKSSDSTAKKHPSDTSSGEVLTTRSSDGRSDNEIEKNHREVSNEEPSGGRSDSEAEADESDASSNNDLSEDFKELTISKQGAARPNETRQQRMTRSGASTGNFDAEELLKDHPWKSKTPSLTEPMNDKVEKSKKYTVSDEWLTLCKKQVDLQNIFSDLPTFIDGMKGPSIRKELEDILNSPLLKVIESTNAKLSPHLLEIAQKQSVPPKDKPSRSKPSENEKLKAFSLPPQQNPHRWFLDCEYMLEMCLPAYSLEWFDCGDQKGKRITKINSKKKDQRWIFTPSFRRAKIALLKWPEDKIVTKESTIRILVVRPSEFEEYVKYCGHQFPVISLPQDEIGAGYPRYWIQKIALRLELQYIWMIDDSVECFYEYAPPSFNIEEYKSQIFGPVFQRIEDLVKATKYENLQIASMSPRLFMKDGIKPSLPFDCKPPQIAVFLNLAALKSKEVYYRPELQVLEDMIFGYECEKNGLKVFIDNCIHVQDHDWTDTGAMSPSVKQTPT